MNPPSPPTADALSAPRCSTRLPSSHMFPPSPEAPVASAVISPSGPMATTLAPSRMISPPSPMSPSARMPPYISTFAPFITTSPPAAPEASIIPSLTTSPIRPDRSTESVPLPIRPRSTCCAAAITTCLAVILPMLLILRAINAAMCALICPKFSTEASLMPSKTRLPARKFSSDRLRVEAMSWATSTCAPWPK